MNKILFGNLNMKNKYVDLLSMNVLSIIQKFSMYSSYFQLFLKIFYKKKLLKISKIYFLKITYFQNNFFKNCQTCFSSSKTILKNNHSKYGEVVLT